MKGRSSVALGFLALIAVGAVALSSPLARAHGTWGGFAEAFFTACSAVCVTGLTVVDVAREFSLTGQIILMVLVEVGCLGLMICGTFLLVAIGRRLSLAQEFSLMNAYGVPEIRGVRSLAIWMVCSMLICEGVGAGLLYYRFHDWYQSIFYSVMSFCNAGFSLHRGSLASFAGDPFSLLVMALETILGGIGFLVIYNLCTFRFLRRPSGGRGRLALHSAVVLRMTGYLLVFTFAAFLLIEWHGVLENYGGAQKLWVAFYQSVTPRTCGFCVTPTEMLHPLMRHIYEILMFIGGAPGSAAAGIKVTTFAVLLYTIRAMCRGEEETVISHRLVPNEIVRESIVIVMALLTFAVIIMGALLVTESKTGIRSDALFFEAISAITTTGLSIGDTTARLSPAGRVVVMVAMFIGRLGALTVVLMIGDRESKRHLRYPSEELVVG